MAFCLNYHLDHPETYLPYSVTDDFTKDPDYRKSARIAYLGYYRYSNSSGNANKSETGRADGDQYAYTATLIWQNLKQVPNSYSLGSDFDAFKSKIMEEYNKWDVLPSFNGSNQTIKLGQTKTLTDTNNVLKYYESFNYTKDGVTFKHSKGNNTMTVKVAENATKENVSLTQNEAKNNKIGKYINDEKVQTNFVLSPIPANTATHQRLLIAYGYNDPKFLRLNINIEQNGRLELSKLNTNGDLIDGAIFNVTGENGFNRDVEVENGKIILEEIKKGIYIVKEKSSPEGYLLNAETYRVEVEPNQTATQAIVNSEPVGEITIEKTDKDTGNKNRIDETSHHGDASIKGAEYTLYAKEDIYNVERTIKYFSKDEPIAKFIFDEYGVASIKITNTSTPAKINVNGSTLEGLPMGNFYAKETVVPTGYNKDTTIYDYTLSYKNAETPIIKTNGTVINIVQKAPFEVIKISTNTNATAEVVPNAEFTAILSKYVTFYGSFDEAKKHLDEFAEDEYSIFRTRENGHGTSSLLAYGEYTVNETYTPSPDILKVKEFYVTIDKDSQTPVKEIVANDLPFEAYIKIQKKDKKTGKFVTFSNATFELHKFNENTEQWEQVECKVQDKYYKSWTTNNEGVAKTETKLKAGNYKLSEVKTPIGFIGLDGELTFKVDNRNSTLNYDKDFDAWITVTAENRQPTGTLKLNKKVVLREEKDKTIIKDVDFTKISFELVADERIIDYVDGSTIYEKGKVVGKYNLKADGTLTVTDLPMGKYLLKELTTIDGAVLDNTEHKVIFEQTDTTTKVYNVNLNIENKTTCTEISKTDIAGEKELTGAKLKVIDENNNIIDSWTSGEKAHKIEGLVVGKEYTLTEEIAPDYYVKATLIKFTVKNTADIQRVVMIDKVVEIIKTDLISGKELEGAELEVIDKETEETIDKWTSSKEPHKVLGLEENKPYILKEITCPYGYEQAEEIEFTVTEDKKTQKIEMKDMPILKDIRVVKIDNKTKEIIKDKFTFGLYEDSECTKLIKQLKANKKDGFVTFEDMRYGTFYIKELKSPKNYELSNRVAKVEINDKGVFVDGVEIQDENTVYSFEFENEKIETPKTGDTRNILLTISISIISLLGLATLIVIKLKNRSK